MHFYTTAVVQTRLFPINNKLDKLVDVTQNYMIVLKIWTQFEHLDGLISAWFFNFYNITNCVASCICIHMYYIIFLFLSLKIFVFDLF